MFYYNISNKGYYTNNKRLAELKVKTGEWADFGESEEEFVMQSDGSGYVPKSEYIPIEEEVDNTPSIEERVNILEAENEILNDTLLTIVEKLDDVVSTQ